MSEEPRDEIELKPEQELPPQPTSDAHNPPADEPSSSEAHNAGGAAHKAEKATPLPSQDGVGMMGSQSPLKEEPQKPKMGKAVPREKPSYLKRWFSQLVTMLKTDAILTFIRGWKGTLLTLVAPIFFLLILFILQEVASILGVPENRNPDKYQLDHVPMCTVGSKGRCISLMFSPDTPDTRNIINNFEKNRRIKAQLPEAAAEIVTLSELTLPDSNLMYVAVPNEDFIYDYAVKFPNVTQFAVSFKQIDNAHTYLLWYNSSLFGNETSDVEEPYGMALLTMTNAFDQALIDNIASKMSHPKINYNIKVRDWPTQVENGPAQTVIKQSGPMIFFCSAMVNFLLILNTIVTEKEQKLRHGLQMMGLFSSVYWTSWLLINTIIVIASSLITCLFGMAFGFRFFTKANFGALFLLFFLFSEAMTFFAFFLSTFVRRVGVATLIGIFILIIGLVFMLAVFGSPFVGYIWWEAGTGPGGWIVLMFVPFFNFGKLYLDIATLTLGEYQFATASYIEGPGFGWGDLYEKLPPQFVPRFGTYDIPIPAQSLYFLIMNIFFYGILAWYFDNVIPDEFGNSRSVYFFLLPSYWGIGTKKKKAVNTTGFLEMAKKEVEDEDVHQERLKALDEERGGKEAVRLLYLRKIYSEGLFKRTHKIAVEGSCWTLSEGNLLALLGQNGAGKSTSINMLCGFSKPSSGDAFIFGNSIRTDMVALREMMGVCPQHDILFKNLTAKEHIELFAGIKSIPRSEIPKLVEERLTAVRLWKVKDKPAGTYSGGMKRRLSVAVSTIGDPQILFLDEPTTGMDPVNRRHVWTFLENFKVGRAIILTTHSMEEADILGDKIAIMALGRLRAFGTSVSLKGKFGAGYRISLVTDSGFAESVQEYVGKNVPGAVLEDDSAGALIFRIPLDSITSITNVVTDLESGAINGVREWGISQSTLEEVFLKIIKEVNPTHGKK